MQLVTKDTNAVIEVDESVFAYEYKQDLVHQAVVRFLNNARQGDSAQKTRAEVRGGGKKPWKQKGTGRARAGTIRSPLWRSGGVIFASKKRDYSQKMNKKMYTRAIRSIIAELCRQDKLLVVSEFACESIKTKDFINKMQSFGLNNALVVIEEMSENEYFASRNLSEFQVCEANMLNPYHLLKFEKVLMTANAIKSLEEQLQ